MAKPKPQLLFLTDEKDIKEFLPLKAPDYPKILKERTEKTLRNLLDKGHRDNENAKCAASASYWIKYYGWLYNPNAKAPYDVFPWIPFQFQEELIDYIQEGIEKAVDLSVPFREDVILPKCREMGGSWATCAVYSHDWQFNNGTFLVLSRKEEEVDQIGNMDTPFEKLRFLLKRQPDWMLPQGFEWKKHSMGMRLINPNGGHIGGDAMTPSAGAGGRVKSIMFDEMAKVRDGKDFKAWDSLSLTANHRVGISTPEGSKNKFARLARNEDNENATVINMNWWKDPRKMVDYSWIDGKLSSPWFRECERTMSKTTLASQVLISFDTSVEGGIYSSQYSDKHQAKNLQPVYGQPVLIGMDPGAHFFRLWTQILPCGCYLCLREDYDQIADIDVVGEKIIKTNNLHFPGFAIEYKGDPAGSHIVGSLGKGKSEYMYLLAQWQIDVEYGFMYNIPKDEWQTRGFQACRSRMTKFCSEHQRPMLQVDIENCPILHRALSGEYSYKVGHDGKPTDAVDEFHPIEDAADAFKYPPLSMGMYIPEATNARPKVPRSRGGEWLPPSQMR